MHGTRRSSSVNPKQHLLFPCQGFPIIYIDMNNPNLHKETMDTVFCYNGNYYVAVTEPDPCVLFYNKEIFESEGLETPEELYQAGDWNFDSLARIAKQLTYSNNSGKRWGLACNYPDIELELITASIDNWMVKLRTSASSGEAIDVFQDSANNNPMYALRGINQPLQDYN